MDDLPKAIRCAAATEVVRGLLKRNVRGFDIFVRNFVSHLTGVTPGKILLKRTDRLFWLVIKELHNYWCTYGDKSPKDTPAMITQIYKLKDMLLEPHKFEKDLLTDAKIFQAAHFYLAIVRLQSLNSEGIFPKFYTTMVLMVKDVKTDTMPTVCPTIRDGVAHYARQEIKNMKAMRLFVDSLQGIVDLGKKKRAREDVRAEQGGAKRFKSRPVKLSVGPRE